MRKKSPQDAKAVIKFNDRGGNELRFGLEKIDELHLLWDGKLVELTAGGSGFVDLAEILKDESATTVVDDGDDIHKWAAVWVGESVKLANSAFKDLKFGKAKLNAAKDNIISIKLSFSNGIDDYEDVQKDVALQQMTKASIRLANLLNRILK